MVVLKEFPARYRNALEATRAAGFTRIPSMPMTTLSLDYKNFDDYLARLLSANSRATVRRKLRVAARAEPPIRMDVVVDASPIVDQIYPLYRKSLRALAAEVREAHQRILPRHRTAHARQDAFSRLAAG